MSLPHTSPLELDSVYIKAKLCDLCGYQLGTLLQTGSI